MTRAAPAIAFDVSVMLGAPMSGIPRVMHAVAAQLLDADDVAFCRFDDVAQRFDDVDAGIVRQAVEAAPTARTRGFGVPAPPRTSARPGVEGLARRRPATTRALLRTGYHARRALAEARALPTSWGRDRRHRSGACASDAWTPDTVYCSLGLDRGYGDLGRLARLRADRGFATLLTVYDLIPIVAPQYVSPDGGDALHPAARMTFAEHFAHLVHDADHLLVISESTRRDTEAFAASLGVACPPTTLLPLGSSVPDVPGERPHSLPAGAAPPGRFALAVGTVEIRKNHHLLLDVWERLLHTRARDEVPELVVVGKRGWLFEETYARLTRTPAFAGVVHHVEDATDPELAWCYRNAAFTCVPSHYEGWGLPVSESLAVGTPCLTSDTSSLPEAGQGLTDLLDPLDPGAWHDRIVELWTDPDALRRRSDAIAERYRPVDPADTARTVVETARSLRSRG